MAANTRPSPTASAVSTSAFGPRWAPSAMPMTMPCGRVSSRRLNVSCWTASASAPRPMPAAHCSTTSKAGTTPGGATRPSATNRRCTMSVDMPSRPTRSWWARNREPYSLQDQRSPRGVLSRYPLKPVLSPVASAGIHHEPDSAHLNDAHLSCSPSTKPGQRQGIARGCSSWQPAGAQGVLQDRRGGIGRLPQGPGRRHPDSQARPAAPGSPLREGGPGASRRHGRDPGLVAMMGADPDVLIDFRKGGDFHLPQVRSFALPMTPDDPVERYESYTPGFYGVIASPDDIVRLVIAIEAELLAGTN